LLSTDCHTLLLCDASGCYGNAAGGQELCSLSVNEWEPVNAEGSIERREKFLLMRISNALESLSD
jgi:hypothetical protein